MATVTEHTEPAERPVRRALVSVHTEPPVVDGGPALVTVTRGARKQRVTVYEVRSIPCSFGQFAFRWVKVAGAGTDATEPGYDVLVSGQDSQCTCKGFQRHGWRPCADCLGAGHVEGETCPECRGRGRKSCIHLDWSLDAAEAFTLTKPRKPCPRCGGCGQVALSGDLWSDVDQCPSCDGSGLAAQPKEETVAQIDDDFEDAKGMTEREVLGKPAVKATTECPCCDPVEDMPAFPTLAEVNGKEVIGSDGMRLRDYFAAHAPPVPDWFVHLPPSRDGIPPLPDPAAYFATEGERREAESWLSDPGWDLASESGQRFAEAAEAHWQAKERWRQDNQMAKVVQWRWQFARAMVEGRP